MTEPIIMYTDGGSRGNPGIAGIGVVVMHDGQVKEYNKFIGTDRTNNEAEYEALIFGLKKIKQLLGNQQARKAEVACFSDSELMVKQLTGSYKLKDEKIQKYFITIWNLKLDFKTVQFKHVPREENQRADRLANQAMNEGSGWQKKGDALF